MGGGSSKGVLLVSRTCVLPADLGGGRGTVSLHRDEGIGSPPRAGGVSAVCRAGRGCECCIGRFLEKGVARTQSRSCAEIGGDLDKQNEKTSPAPTLRSKDSRNTETGSGWMCVFLPCTAWPLKFPKGVLEEESAVSDEALLLDWTWISGFRLLPGFRG